MNPENGEDDHNAEEIQKRAHDAFTKPYKIDDDSGDPNQKPIMSPELANIVLVKKEEMEQWLEKQKKLKAELDATKRKVQAKLAEYKRGYADQEEKSRQ